MLTGMLYTACQFLTKGFSFVIIPIISRLMSLEAYGIVSNFMAWHEMLTPIVTLNLVDSVSKAKYKYGDINSFIVSIVAMTGITTTIFYCFTLTQKEYMLDIFSIEDNMLELLFLYSFVSSLFQIIQIKNIIFYRHKQYVIITLVCSLSNLLLSLLFVSFFPNKALGRVLGVILPTSFIAITLLSVMLFNGARFNFDSVKFALPIGIPTILTGVSYILLASADRVMIKSIRNAEEVALYSMAYSVGTIATIIREGVSLAKGPWIMDRLNSRHYNEIRIPTRTSFFYYALMIVLLIFTAPELLLMIGGERYMMAQDVIPSIIISMVLMFTLTYYQTICYFYKKNVLAAFFMFISAAFNIALNYVFIPKYGYIAAAYTTLAGYTLLLLLFFLASKYIIKKADIYDNRFFAKTILLLILVQGAVYAMYSLPLLRYVLLLMYILTCILYASLRKSTISFLKKK